MIRPTIATIIIVTLGVPAVFILSYLLARLIELSIGLIT